jgi:hypothetical protein
MSPIAKFEFRSEAEELAHLSVVRNSLRSKILDLSEAGTYADIQILSVRIRSISRRIKDLESRENET